MIPLTLRTRVELSVSDRVMLFAAAQEIALHQPGTPLPADVPSALRTLLTHVPLHTLESDPAAHGLEFGPLAARVLTRESGLEGWTRRPFPGLFAPVVATLLVATTP